MSYGNGATVEYAYDELERVTDVYYNGSVDPVLHYSYTGEGAVGSLTDHRTGREYGYVYDSLGRLNGMTERENGTEVQSYTASYDTANRLVSAEYSVSPDGSGTMTGTRSTACSYEGSDGKLSAMTSPAGSFSYTYDGLKRLAEKELTGVSTEEFTYCAGQEAGTTTLLAESKRTKKADGSTVSEYTYTYDALGNMTAISGSTNASYTYDNQSQLLSETLEGITTCYTYDSVGNIRSVSEGGTTHTYTYGDAEWKDLLTAYDGHPITYDAIGNPLQWHDGRSFTWTEGRRLASSTGNGNVISYTYNADGLRLTKNVNGTEHRYTWQGSRLISEYWAGNTLEFFYDESGRPAALRHNGAAYYYVTNLQGDITHILDASGNVCAEYSYNAWGRILSATGTMAVVNPLRYRGYYYDAESGWYYLQNRYYDPEVCRFINADEHAIVFQSDSPLGSNLYTYCNNSPVSQEDESGNIGFTVSAMIVGGIIGSAISAVSSVVTQERLTGEVNWKSVLVATAMGFVGGAVAASPLRLTGQIIVGGALGGLGYIADSYANNEELKLDEAAISVAMGALAGAIGGAGANENQALTTCANSTKQTILRETRRANQNYAQKRIALAIGARNNTLAISAWNASSRFAAGTTISNVGPSIVSRLKKAAFLRKQR